jgi:hypothetical protein
VKIHTLVLALIFSATAGAALADGRAEAKLLAPLAKPVTVMAGEAFWTCQGSNCVAEPASEQILTVSACKAVAKAAGPISAYGVDRRALPANLMVKCNAAALAR